MKSLNHLAHCFEGNILRTRHLSLLADQNERHLRDQLQLLHTCFFLSKGIYQLATLVCHNVLVLTILWQIDFYV